MENVPPAAAPEATDAVKLQAELAAARQQAAEYLDGWKRAKADYLNLQRESQEQSWQQAKLAVRGFAANLWTDYYGNVLPAFQHIPRAQAALPWVNGLKNGIRQFEAILKKLGFEPVAPPVGSAFDPIQQEAVESVEIPGGTPNSVAAVLRPGLRSTDDGALIVPAQVKVAK